MRRLAIVFSLWVCVGWIPVAAGPAKVIKVLPHLLDAQGRNSVAPSLYERDAYQAQLRTHPEQVKSLRFDILWKYSQHYMEGIRLRLEVRGSKDPQVLVLEQAVEPRRWYKRWTSISLDEATFKKLGEVVSWRVTLWDGERSLAEQHSFLW